ncbi:MAG: hypothetical protein SH850_07565 [Planctomycetaceae bacterium]|nr:hypothetical protein [Planctomycetaceae bacterium]
MSDSHADHGAAVTGHTEHAAHAPTAGDHRFEKSELEEFTHADRGAGQHIGILLALLFVVLLTLMSGATIWTYIHQNASDDPHAVQRATDRSGH